MGQFRETRHFAKRAAERPGMQTQFARSKLRPPAGYTNGEKKPCRLCGKSVPLRKRQMYANTRQHRKHVCPHGQECPTGVRGLISQTLTPGCAECRAELASLSSESLSYGVRCLDCGEWETACTCVV